MLTQTHTTHLELHLELQGIHSTHYVQRELTYKCITTRGGSGVLYICAQLLQ